MKDQKPVVWIISYFANGPTYFPRVPDYNIAEYLQRKDYNMLIFAGSSVHNTNKNFIEDDALYKEQMVDNVPFVFVRSRNYESRKGETLSFIDFYRNLMKIYRKFPKPDIIISQMPQPLGCLAGIRIQKGSRSRISHTSWTCGRFPSLNMPAFQIVIRLFRCSILSKSGFIKNRKNWFLHGKEPMTILSTSIGITRSQEANFTILISA